MPTIKCSSCAQQVEISAMGEHICPGDGGAATAGDTFMPLGKSVHDKIGVIPPVDTAMASMLLTRPVPNWSTLYPTNTSKLDRSYSRQPLTPLSLSSGSRSVSPRTPGARPSIGRADDYFAPTIANDEQIPPLRPGGYGGFSDMDSDSAYGATSPKKQGLSLLTRIDSIAAGPYASENPYSPVDSRMPASPPRSTYQDNERLGTSASNTGFGGMAPPKMPRKNGYGGFGPPKRDDQGLDAFGGPNRSQTFPDRPTETDRSEPPLRAPSAPGPRPDRLRDTSRPPPPRRSLVRAKNPSINLDAEFGSANPYHSPSVSVSSSLSRGSSQPSDPSSNTSPARSTTSRRKPSDISAFDSLMSDIQSSMDELQPRETPPVRAPARPEPPRQSLSNDRYDPATRGREPPSPPPSRWGQDRVDPAVQGSRRTESTSRLPPSPTRTRAPAPHRGYCRKCNDAITGKSISSADGRLTGRYHKACFVCTTCFEPFQTAEFYVHDDRPYCKYHYHKINGSLCGSCQDGIEGQYLEDESTKKFHVNCFRCGDCKVVLRDGYFEVDGRAYCEKDAWRRLQPQSYRRSPSVSSQRSVGRSNLAPPGPGRPSPRGRPGPPNGGLPHRPGMSMGGGRPGAPMPNGPSGLAPPQSMPKMEKRRTRLGMM